MSKRSMVKLIHADSFYSPEQAPRYISIVNDLKWKSTPYGKEVENINIIKDDCESIFSKVIGERVVVDHDRSGVFRKPTFNAIRFEDFNKGLNEWCFVVALEPNTFNIWHHISDNSFGEFSDIDKFSVLDNLDSIDFNNLFEWKIGTNITLEPNQGVFFRPWVFHSLHSGIVQYYRFVADTKFRVMIMGLPDSSKNKVATELHKLLPQSELLVSNNERERHRDIDYSEKGQERHMYRLVTSARNSNADIILVDATCSTPKLRSIFQADVLVWVNDGKQQYDGFVKPNNYDIKINTLTDDSIHEIIERIETKKNAN